MYNQINLGSSIKGGYQYGEGEDVGYSGGWMSGVKNKGKNQTADLVRELYRNATGKKDYNF